MCPLRRFYEKNFSKVKIYDRTLWKSYAATVAFLSSIITLISFFNTAEESCIGIKWVDYDLYNYACWKLYLYMV